MRRAVAVVAVLAAATTVVSVAVPADARPASVSYPHDSVGDLRVDAFAGADTTGSALSTPMTTRAVATAADGAILVGGDGIAFRVGTDGSANPIAGDGYDLDEQVPALPADGTGVAASSSGFATAPYSSTVYSTPAWDDAGDLAYVDPENGYLAVVPATTGTAFGRNVTAGRIVDLLPSLRQDLVRYTAFDGNGDVLLVRADSPARIELVARADTTAFGQHVRAGDSAVIAGGSANGCTGDGGPATAADIDLVGVGGIAVDPAGNLVLPEEDCGTIRVVAARTGTSYGIAMTAGDVYTVGGLDGKIIGVPADGSPARGSILGQPNRLRVGADGDLLYEDAQNHFFDLAGATGTRYGIAMTAGDVYQLPLPTGQWDGSDSAGDVFSDDLAPSGGDEVLVRPATTRHAYGLDLVAGQTVRVAGTGDPYGSDDVAGPLGTEQLQPDDVLADTQGDLALRPQTPYGSAVAPRVVVPSGSTDFGHTARTAGAQDLVVDDAKGAPPPLATTEPAFDGDGNLLWGDGGSIEVWARTSGTFYRTAMTAGHVYDLLDLDQPDVVDAVAADAQGNLVYGEDEVDFSAQPEPHDLRVLAETVGRGYGQLLVPGQTYVIAGDGSSTDDGQKGTDTSYRANYGQPGFEQIAFDSEGDVLFTYPVATQTGAVYPPIRVLAETSGPAYGVSMTSGDAYTLPVVARKFAVGPADALIEGAWQGQASAASAFQVAVTPRANGTLFGVAMTAGKTTEVAGTSDEDTFLDDRPSGDGGPATKAGFTSIQGVAYDSATQRIYVATGHRIRVLTEPPTAPGTPTATATTDASGSAAVSWTAPTSSGSSAITGYVVTASPGGKTTSVSASTTSATVSGLALGTSYTFTVTASNSAASTTSAPSNPVTPLGPRAADGVVPVTSTRVLDTRTGSGALTAGGSITVQVTGHGSVPSTGVAAVLVDLTAVSPSASGYVTAWPGGSERPYASSVLFTTGRTIDNLALVPVSAAGTISLFVSSRTQLLADVEGYVAGQSGAVSEIAGSVDPTTSARLLDTRTSGRPVSAGGVVTVQAAGRGGVPSSGAGAVLVDVTAVSPSASGYVTAWPAGARPYTSSVLFTKGTTIDNLVLVPLSSTGSFSLYASSTTQLLADVEGYVVGSPSTTVGAVVPAVSARLLDTRATGRPVAAGGTVTVPVTGRGGLPSSGVSAVLVDVTAVSPSASGYVTAWPGGSRPYASSVLFTTGTTIDNLVLVPVSSTGTISLFVSSSTHLLVDVEGYVRG